MIVANAQIAMAASHDYREMHQVTEKLDFWLTNQSTDNSSVAAPSWGEQVFISERGVRLLEMQRNQQSLDLNKHMDSHSRINLYILQQLYEAITGRKMNLIDPSEMNPQGTSLEVSGAPSAPAQASQPESAGYGLVYDRQEIYQEQESLSFSAQGVIRTQDGREINFSSALTMSRNYVEASNLNIRMGDAKKIDPLVINFDGKGAELSQTRFQFDVEADGHDEQLASLKAGSGFLAFDRNGDGQINDGSELFGPSSSRGFSELARFDEDGNHFIDEGDSIYNRLRIWATNPDGSSQLLALGDKNVGAIFLGHLTTPFQLKDESNRSLGEVANTGLYLGEDGKVGVVQEINLTV